MDNKTEKINDDTCKLYIGGVNTEWSSDRVKEILEEQSGCDVMRVDVVKNFAFAVRTIFEGFDELSIQNL